MNPQIIQPIPGAINRPINPQPVARPIVYSQQPANYQSKTVLPTPHTNQIGEQRPLAIVNRPAAAIQSRQRTIIKGSDDESTLLSHGQVQLSVKTHISPQNSTIDQANTSLPVLPMHAGIQP